MVKFGRELEAELVSDWKEMYMNYKELKKPIKKIKLLRQPKHSSNFSHDDLFGGSIFGAVSCLARKFSRWFRSSGDTSGQVKTVILEGHESVDEEESEEFSDEDLPAEIEVVDMEEEEVNKLEDLLEKEVVKVNEFHQLKEAEMVERAEILNNQLRSLLQLHRFDHCRQSPLAAAAAAAFNSIVHRSFSLSSAAPCDTSESDVASEVDAEAASQIQPEEVAAALEKMLGKSNKSVRIDVPSDGDGAAAATSSTSSLGAMFGNLAALYWKDLQKIERCDSADFIRNKMQSAEKMIREALVEFYADLFRLKSFSSLNMLGFTKIMKKFDKVTNRQESGTYLRKVKGKHFVTSDMVGRLVAEVECLFTEHFAGNDRKKAMKLLKPQQRQNSHIASFLVGVCTGCWITLFIVYAILAHLCGLFSPPTTTGYMETVYPVFSIFALLSLHLFMYGCNLFFWEAKRINYISIFNFQPKTALKHIDAFLICTSFMAVVVLAMVIHLLLKTDGFLPTEVDTIPGFLLLSFIAFLICPFNILYRPTRYCFLRVTRNIVSSPFCKVLMVDFFMADQLTSQIPLLRHIETTACYYAASTFRTHDFEACKSGKRYRQLAYLISFSPYYWRAMQCGRRWFEESNTTHLANMGKYLSAMVAAGARLRYAQQKGSLLWIIIVLVTSIIATIYQLYWDFVKDWGLLNPNAKNPWLRDNLLLKKKSIHYYYISIVVNVVLRVAWVESVLKFKVGTLENGLLDFLTASFEVIRRGQWNFYRVEYEHLNNAGKFRAEKTVHLPFREAYSDN